MTDWINEEEDRTKEMAKKGQKTVNPKAKKPRGRKKVEVERTQKLFRPQVELANRFDLMATQQKIESGKSRPELIDEAITLLLKKYEKKQGD